MFLIDYIRERVPDAAKTIPISTICVEATPVWKWCEINRKKEYNITTDFPFLRLPYPHLWIEHSNTDEDEVPCRIGVHAYEIPSKREKFFEMRFEVYSKFADEDCLSILPCGYAINVGEDGTVELGMDMLPRIGVYLNPSMPEDAHFPASDKQLMESMSQAVVAMFSISFMNCKNIVVKVDRDSSPKLDKKRERVGKPPLVRMHTLMIDGIKRLFSELTGSQRFTHAAYHLCRGHFKDFSHGRGLFGKYTGRYWWASQARGSKEFGEVKKDYLVKR